METHLPYLDITLTFELIIRGNADLRNIYSSIISGEINTHSAKLSNNVEQNRPNKE